MGPLPLRRDRLLRGNDPGERTDRAVRPCLAAWLHGEGGRAGVRRGRRRHVILDRRGGRHVRLALLAPDRGTKHFLRRAVTPTRTRTLVGEGVAPAVRGDGRCG